MVKSRKSKYILVVAMALCFVMAFSASAFAGVNATGTSTVSISDIISSINDIIGDDIFRGDWRPDNNPVDNIKTPPGPLNTLYFSDGVTVVSSSDFDKIRTYLNGHSLGQDYEWYIYTVTGIEDLFSRVYFSDSPFNKNSSSINSKLRLIEYFAGKEISYFYNATLGLVLCNLSNQPILYINDVSVTQKEVANIPVQAGGDNVLNEDNRKYYYDNSVVNNTTEIYEGDTITYEGDTIINEGDTITTNNYDYGQTIEGDLIDINGGTLNMPNGDIYQIEDYIYNEDNDTYYYSTTNNNQTYNFTVQYYYEYTYVVYLGSSEEYKPEAYKFYYELPDGRSSADLTADELAGMSVQFADVVTYDRAASDEVVEGLWHLDGSLENTAFNNNSQMYFNSGASISYIEDAGFEGALYLPALNGAREWWNNIGISTDNGTVLPQSVQDYFSSIFTYPHDQLYSSNVKSYNINDNSFNFSVDFRFYNYADANDSTGTMFTYQPYFNQISETSRSPFVGKLNAQTLQFFKIDFLGSSLKFYNQNGSNTTTVSYSPGTWNHILVNYSFTLGRYGQNSAVGDVPTTYSITYLPSVTVYLNGVLVYSFESTNTSSSAYYLNNIFYSSTNYNTAVDYFINGNKFLNSLQGVKFSSSSNTVPFAIDEIRITDTNVPNLVSPVPYEDNLVWVLPDSTNLAANTLAIQSDYLSGKYRVGGIRPSMVEKGHVWFQISMNRIVSCQVYNGIMWEEVNCYVWTGSRWIPANYFDVVTLTDYYDIADNTGLPTITTSEGFFSWFQREFKDFKDAALNYFEAWEGGEYGAGGTTNNNTTIIAPSLTANGTLDANISIDNKFEFDLGTNAGDVLQGGFEGVSGVFRGMWQLGGDVFGSISEGVTFIFDFLTPSGSDTIHKPVDFWYFGF